MKFFDPNNRSDFQYDVHIPGYHALKKDTDTIMSREAWLDGVECGMFIDYDGYGHGLKLVEGNFFVAQDIVRPSMVDAGQFSDSVEWVVWYNR